MDITKSRQLAFNENTQTAILDKLAHHPNDFVRQLVAQRRNTTLNS